MSYIFSLFLDNRAERLPPETLPQRLLPDSRGGQERLFENDGSVPPVGRGTGLLQERDDHLL